MPGSPVAPTKPLSTVESVYVPAGRMIVSWPEPALQPSTGESVLAAIIASPSVQSPTAPGLWAVELTVIVDPGANGRFSLGILVRKKDGRFSLGGDGRDPRTRDAVPGLLPDTILPAPKSLFAVLSVDPVAPYRTADKTSAQTNRTPSTVRRCFARRVESDMPVTNWRLTDRLRQESFTV